MRSLNVTILDCFMVSA